MSRYTRRLTAVRFEDAVGLGLTISPTEGDLTMGDNNAEFAEHQPVYDRDVHDGFTIGQDLVQDCSITVQMKNEALTSGVSARILDFVLKRGTFSAATSMDSTIWSWKTIVTYDDGTTSTTRTLSRCEGSEGLNSGQPANTIAISFKSHLAPVDA